MCGYLAVSSAHGVSSNVPVVLPEVSRLIKESCPSLLQKQTRRLLIIFHGVQDADSQQKEQQAQSNAYLNLMPLALPAPPVAGDQGFGGAPAYGGAQGLGYGGSGGFGGSQSYGGQQGGYGQF